jgi:predicted Fe-Mo cluster-binding NifX family protein
MRIAVVTDDGQTVSQHFGRARQYFVATVENGAITQHELRDKLGHDQLQGEGEGSHGEGHGHGHGHGPQADHRHGRMLQAVADCEAVLAGGMGQGAYQSLRARGIRPVVTDLTSVEEAVLAYASGTIVDRTDRLH